MHLTPSSLTSAAKAVVNAKHNVTTSSEMRLILDLPWDRAKWVIMTAFRIPATVPGIPTLHTSVTDRPIYTRCCMVCHVTVPFFLEKSVADAASVGGISSNRSDDHRSEK